MVRLALDAPSMTGLPMFTVLWHIGCGLLAGAVAGAVHFRLLALNVRLFLSGRAGVALLLQLARLAATVAVLVVLARLGAWAVLAGGVGVVLARQRALHQSWSKSR
jgi:F1F0 ATPase subunit 2